jgi:hypothetical protein
MRNYLVFDSVLRFCNYKNIFMSYLFVMCLVESQN